MVGAKRCTAVSAEWRRGARVPTAHHASRGIYLPSPFAPTSRTRSALVEELTIFVRRFGTPRQNLANRRLLPEVRVEEPRHPL